MTSTRTSLKCVLMLLALGLPYGICVAADTINGAKLYGTHCASCHGNKGEGVMPGAPNLTRGNALLQPDSRLLNSIMKGKNGMPGYLGILKEREILDVVAHLRTFN